MASPRDPLDFLRNADLIKIEDVFFWDKSRPPEIASLDTDAEYIVKDIDRYDFLAFKKLQSSSLGWAIMHRNEMRLWPNDMVPGATIRIPMRDSLRQRGII